MDLLEYYRAQKAQVDVLSDPRALFLLALAQQLKLSTLQQLAAHLRWSHDEVRSLWSKIAEAGFGEDLLFGGSEGDRIRFSPAGQKELLRLGLVGNGTLNDERDHGPTAGGKERLADMQWCEQRGIIPMPTLSILKDKQVLKEHLLPDADVVVIGRTQSSDVVLPDETRKVSRFHAAMVRLSSQPLRYFIRDLGSAHGTSVNGVHVQQKILCDGDVIEIGDYRLSCTSLAQNSRRPRRIKVVERKADGPFTEKSTIALRLMTVPGMDALTETQREVLEEFQYKARRGASLSQSADAVVGATLRALQADRGFIGQLRRSDLESLIEMGATNLGEDDEIEISDSSFIQHLFEGKAIEESATLLIPFSNRRDVTYFLCVSRQSSRGSFGAQEVAFLRAAAKVLEAWPGKPEGGSPIHDGEVMEWPVEMICRSKKMNEVVKQIEIAASSRMNVLILGESGSGKELVARALHTRLSQPAGQFIAKNCGQTTETLAETAIFGYAPKSGISEADPKGAAGWFEQANGGTLFLDEVHRMTPAMQDMFLRVLQDKQVWRIGAQAPVVVNVNVIAATDEDLEAALELGSFRKPFYFRFGARIQIPPLRERREDIPLLTYFFLDKYAKALGSRARTISRRGMRILVENSWLGNIRQLENVIQGAVAKNQEVIFSWDLEEQLRESTSARSSEATAAPAGNEQNSQPSAKLPRRMEEVEKEQIEEALEVTLGNKTKAAALLGFKSRQTILSKMDRYRIPRNYADPHLKTS